MVVVGTRPEAIKLAPVVLALRDDPRYDPILVTTAQHREMLDQVLEFFSITPDHDLGIMQAGQSLASVTTRGLQGLNRIIADRSPELVMVQGDTTSTFVGALAGFYHQVPVAHVEAGLRTLRRYAPFPEEINRRLVTQLASLHLAPTPEAVSNLLTENVAAEEIVCTGNTVIDALRWAVSRQIDFGVPELADLDRDPRRVVLVTMHRRESWDGGLGGVGRALVRLAVANPDFLVVIPLHLNPAVRKAVLPVVGNLENIVVVEPLPYGAFTRLLARADLVMTDSGGIQEEAPALGKPVLVLRDVTERPEGVAAGAVELVGTDEEVILDRAQKILTDSDVYGRMTRAVDSYGDGRAASRIVEAIAWFFGEGPRPFEFRPGSASGKHS